MTRKVYRRGGESVDIASESPTVAEALEAEMEFTLGHPPNIDPTVLDGLVHVFVEVQLQELEYV